VDCDVHLEEEERKSGESEGQQRTPVNIVVERERGAETEVEGELGVERHRLGASSVGGGV